MADAETHVGGKTFIRVKRKRDQEPLDAFVLVGMMPASKRRAYDSMVSAFASLSTSNEQRATEARESAEQQSKTARTACRLFRLAHTVKSKEPAEAQTVLDKLDLIKEKRKRTLGIPKEEKNKLAVQLHQEQARKARFRVVERHRTKMGLIIDIAAEHEGSLEKGKLRPPPVPAHAKTAPSLKPPSARRWKPKLSEKTLDRVRTKGEQPSVTTVSEEQMSQMYLPMVKSHLAEIKGKEKLDAEDDYEYDLYYFDDTADREITDKEYGVVHIESFDEELVLENEYDEHEEQESDDSNDENNPKNDYPEEEDSWSSEEAQDSKDWFSDLSSEDEHLVYGHQPRDEYSHEEVEGASDGSDDGDRAAMTAGIQQDLAFFRTWFAARK